jgi:hypothetical protein
MEIIKMYRKANNILAAALLGLFMGSTAHAACSVTSSAATPFLIGPPNPNNGFAEYLTDTNGLSLELCLGPSQPTLDPVTGAVISPVGAAPFCFFDPPDPAVAFSQQIGFGFEGFWWLAAPDTTAFPATMRAVLVLGAEAAFLGEIVDGGQFPFTRLRVRLDLPAVGFYRVTEPFGIHEYDITALVPGSEVFDSFDVEFPVGSVDANGVITEATSANNCVGPWLTWDTFPGDPALDITGDDVADFIGDGATSHAITSVIPGGVNFFRIEAWTDSTMATPLAIDPADTDANGSTSSVETNLWTVVGKVYDGQLATPMVAERTTYSRDAAAAGQADIFTAGADTAVVTATGGPNLGGPFNLLADTGSYFESILLTPDASVVPPVVEVDATDGGAATPTDTTHLVRQLVDLVQITRADYDVGKVPPELAIEATSSDALVPPTLTLVQLNQTLAAGSVLVTEASPGVLLTPPGVVTVSSTAGGSATRLVEVINSDVDGDGIPNDVDNCPLTANTDQANSDSDEFGDVCDNCTLVANADQRDTDGDDYGNICDADLNNSGGTVNLSDYSLFRAAFGANVLIAPLTPAQENADFTGDGRVNLSDYSIFRQSFGKAPGPSGLNP